MPIGPLRERIDWLVLGLLHRDPNWRVPQRAKEEAAELQALLEGQPQRLSGAIPQSMRSPAFSPPTWAEPTQNDSWHPPQWQPRQIELVWNASPVWGEHHL